MVECGGLENRLPLRGYEGSNPSSSASIHFQVTSGSLFFYLYFSSLITIQ